MTTKVKIADIENVKTSVWTPWDNDSLVTEKAVRDAIDWAIVDNFDTEESIMWFKDTTNSVVWSSWNSWLDFSIWSSETSDTFSAYAWSWDLYIYNLIWWKSWTSNVNLRWDDIDILEMEFNFASDTDLWGGDWRFVWLADSSATTAWTEDTSTQRKVLFSSGNLDNTNGRTLSSDWTTASSSSAYSIGSIQNRNKYKIIFNQWTNILVYVNDVLVDTKTTNLPSWTNNVTIWIWKEASVNEIMYLSPIKLRVKYI